MLKIPVAEARSGMELAEPAISPDGRVLLHAGAPLSEGALKALKQAGVASLTVRKDGESEEEAILAAVERLSARFAAVSGDAMMAALRDAVETRLRAGWLE